MQRLTWVVLLLGVGVARAQVGTNVLQRLFLPVISYRLASTATLLEDDLDRMLDPSMAGPVQGEIVAAGTQIDVVRVGPPLHRHAQEIHIEALAGLQVRHIERHVTQTAGGLGPLHVSTPFRCGSRSRD